MVIQKWKNYRLNQELCYLFVDIHENDAYFDSKMTTQECYTLGNYIAIPARNYMRVMPHDTSIRLGDKVIFQALSNTSIPAYYYNFATYQQIESRKPNPKPLTDISRWTTSTHYLQRKCTGFYTWLKKSSEFLMRQV